MFTNQQKINVFVMKNQSVYFLSNSLLLRLFAFMIIIMFIPLHVEPVLKLPPEKV